MESINLEFCRGKFITFEGIDRTGKSTNLNYLARLLQAAQIPFVITRGLGGTQLGHRIRKILLDDGGVSKSETPIEIIPNGGNPIKMGFSNRRLEKSKGYYEIKEVEDISPMSELLLVLGARVDHMIKIIKPNLAQGICVLCDRFDESTYAYQEIEEEVINQLREITKVNIQPDLTFVFDAPVSTAFSRPGPDGTTARMDKMEGKSDLFFERARGVFLTRAQKNPNSFIIENDSLENVQKKMINIITDLSMQSKI